MKSCVIKDNIEMKKKIKGYLEQHYSNIFVNADGINKFQRKEKVSKLTKE